MSVFDSDYAETRREEQDLYLGPPGWDYPEEPDPEESPESFGDDDES